MYIILNGCITAVSLAEQEKKLGFAPFPLAFSFFTALRRKTENMQGLNFSKVNAVKERKLLWFTRDRWTLALEFLKKKNLLNVFCTSMIVTNVTNIKDIILEVIKYIPLRIVILFKN